MNGDTMNQDVQGVSCGISGWLDDVRRLLQSVQLVLENASPAEGAPSEVAVLLGKLPPMVRQCRSQIPTDRMVQIWVRELADIADRMRLHPGTAEPSRARLRRESLTA